MLIDKVLITIQSGRGGNGSNAINVVGSASGADGGAGGNVYVIGDENIYDLSHFTFGKTYKAGNGENGERRLKTGADGKDLIIKVPLITEIRHNKRLICRISKHGQKEPLLQGGAGGFGNTSISKASKDGIYNDSVLPQKGEAGIEKEINLILKLQSDVIFLGLPNAGKSSMLNTLTDAQAKVAPYAFTTLEPQIGLMKGIRLMDLPGLIEKTAEGKGLGTRFLKHTETARLVVHFVSLIEENPINGYKIIKKEVEDISEYLASLPEIVVLTKTDEVDSKIIKKNISAFNKIGINPLTVSIIDDESIEKLKEAIIENLKGERKVTKWD